MMPILAPDKKPLGEGVSVGAGFPIVWLPPIPLPPVTLPPVTLPPVAVLSVPLPRGVVVDGIPQAGWNSRYLFAKIGDPLHQ
jgi:hypothetical protein